MTGLGKAFFAALAICTVLATASTASAEVRVSMHDGLVTVVAKDATVRQILTEWARVGQTKIINVERIPGGPISLELTDVPEAEALDVLLRSVSGYMAAPRPTPAANLSYYDRILVMPTPVATRNASAPTVPTFREPPIDDQAGDGVLANPAVPGRGQVFTFPQAPQPQVVNPPAQGGVPMVVPGIGGAIPAPITATPPPAPALFPGAPTSSAPVGSSTPGVVAPAPAAQPGQPAQR